MTPKPCPQGTSVDYQEIRVDGVPAIMFLPCAIVSFNLHDIEHRYCAKCGRFLADRASLVQLARKGVLR